MSSTGCNPAASCCGGSTPPVRTSAIRERRNACLRRRAIPTRWVPLADVRISGRRARGVSAATVERYRTWLEERPRGAARSARSSRRCVPRTRRPTPNRGRACSGTHADRSGGAGMGPRLPRLGRRTVAAQARVAHVIRRAFLGMKLWWRSASFAPRRSGFDSRRPLHLGQHEVGDDRAGSRLPARINRTERGRRGRPSGSTQASVVSTASTRPLYGRGAGSTPAGGSFLRP